MEAFAKMNEAQRQAAVDLAKRIRDRAKMERLRGTDRELKTQEGK